MMEIYSSAFCQRTADGGPDFNVFKCFNSQMTGGVLDGWKERERDIGAVQYHIIINNCKTSHLTPVIYFYAY